MRSRGKAVQAALARTRESIGAFGAFARDAFDFIYPPACAVCECDAPSGSPICARCLLDLNETGAERPCTSCGRPVGEGGDERSVVACPWCDGGGVGHIKRVARLGLMVSPLRELIHQIKFRGRWELADWLGRLVAEQAAVGRLMSEADGIVPVPLHPLRKTYRGYNQAMLLARQLARRSGLPNLAPAVRARSTVAQTALTSVAARQQNLRDAFVLLDPASVHGKRLVLVDDVMTTGATLRSFAYCLWAARPASLGAVVIAVADPRGRAFEVV